MFARWQSESGGARAGVCLGLAVLAHVAAIAGAIVESKVPPRMASALMMVDAIIERPAFAESSEAPKVMPPSVVAPAPTQAAPVATPPADEARRAKAGDPYEQAAAVAAARKQEVGDDGPYDIATTDDDRGPGFGRVAGDGQSDVPTFDQNARIGGVIGGTGVAAAPKGRAGNGEDDGPDRSRRSSVLGGYTDACEFPDAANGIDEAVAFVVVNVRADGTAAAVAVATDPGHGFGAAAQRCAMRSKYVPALDRKGRKIASVTPLVAVRFTR